MWVPVLAANVVAIVAALVLPVIDEHVGERGLPIGRSAVESIFSALAGGMITFTGIVFSAVFVAAQIQTSSYSPRLAARLRRDPVIIAGLAFPIATATYSLVALASLGHETTQEGRDFVPVATVLFGLALALVTLGTFVALVQRAFESTQIGGILRTLLRRGFAVIEEVHPRVDPVEDVVAAPPSDPAAAEVAHSGPPAVIAAIDRAALRYSPTIGATSTKPPVCSARRSSAARSIAAITAGGPECATSVAAGSRAGAAATSSTGSSRGWTSSITA